MVGDSFMRFVDNTVYFISMNPMPTNGVGWVYVDYDAEIVGDNHIKFYVEGKEVFEWKIIAHDNDKIVINTYYKGQQQPDKKYGEFLYSRQLFIRKVDETKCWENAKPYKLMPIGFIVFFVIFGLYYFKESRYTTITSPSATVCSYMGRSRLFTPLSA